MLIPAVKPPAVKCPRGCLIGPRNLQTSWREKNRCRKLMNMVPRKGTGGYRRDGRKPEGTLHISRVSVGCSQDLGEERDWNAHVKVIVESFGPCLADSDPSSTTY